MQTDRMTLSDFLLARIDEDEEDIGTDPTDRGQCEDSFGMHYGRDRTLAECEAKRQIVKLHASEMGECTVCAAEESYSDDSEGNRDYYRSAISYPCPTLRATALPYADHPDYREEWRP